jgi:hypothetical protein
MTCAAHRIKVLSASHDVFKLDSGVRRNDELAGFVCALKPRQPHPNPPLLSQGREQIIASIKLPALRDYFANATISASLNALE